MYKTKSLLTNVPTLFFYLLLMLSTACLSSTAMADPNFVSPSPNSTLSGTNQTFTWAANGVSVERWWLYIGTSVGGRDIADTGDLSTNTQYEAIGLPIDGSTVYMRLWYYSSGRWNITDRTYISAVADNVSTPAMLSPASESVLANGTAEFQWADNNTPVNNWWLYLSSQLGGLNLYNSGATLRGRTSVIVDQLPTDGSTVYARLWYRTAVDGWLYVDSTYTTRGGSDVQDAAAARLLAQATFGASMSGIDSVRQLGIEGWIDNQFTLQGESQYDYIQSYYPNDYSEQVNIPRHHKWLIEAVDGADQLRQRIAFAYSQFLVISDVPESLRISQSAVADYYDLLGEYAFANYRDLLEAVTLSPAMGTYLSMLQSGAGDPANNTRADENFAREVMQLFTIGLHELNLDGSQKLTASGNSIPAYTQQNIEEYARVFTGWSYKNADVWGISTTDPFNHTTDKISPMKPFPGYHDEGRKTLLRSVVSPAGITPEQDLDIALDSLFNHPNVGPFISKQLIQRLVTSNPSPAYVARIASVFNNDGNGVRGDMQAVIRALLLDTEARDGHQTITNYGKLREPLIRWTHLWRAIDVVRGTESKFNQYNHDQASTIGSAGILGQAVLASPSVFNFYRPDYAPVGAIRNAGLVAPEAQIYTEATFQPNMGRISWNTQYNYQSDSNTHATHTSNIEITEEIQLAVSSDALLDRLDLLLLSGQMSQGLRQVLLEHLELLPDDLKGRSVRVRDAINLIMSSPEYFVQR